MRITAKGQVTIPADIREKAGLLPNTDIECVLDGDCVRIVRLHSDEAPSQGAQIVAHLRGRGDQPLSTDEIMAMTRDD